MSYKNDHMLVVANKYGKASMDCKAELWETYDKLRDLTIGGPALGGSGFSGISKYLIDFAQLFAPSEFMPILGNNSSVNIPGTSYFSPMSGGNSITPGGQAAFGFGKLGQFPGFPSGGAAPIGYAIGSLGLPLMMGIGNSLTSLGNDFAVGGASSASSIGGTPTGGAASIVSGGNMANTAGSGVGGVSGILFGQKGSSVILPMAGLIAGIGGLASAIGPYFGPFGMLGGIAGNLAQGYGGAVLNAYQSVSSRIVNNADVILTAKIKNIETVAKQLDTQGDIVRKMLKEMLDGDSKALQTLL